MAATTTNHRVDEEEQQQLHQRLVHCDDSGGVVAREVSKRVSRLAVEGGGAGINNLAGRGDQGGAAVRSSSAELEHGRQRPGGVVGGRTSLPPPHAWLAIEDAKKKHYDRSDPEEQWLRLLRGGAGSGGKHQPQQLRSSFSVVRREHAAREAWLDRAWEMKRSWHERNGGAPDADTPVVVVVGKESSSSSPSSTSQHAGAVGGGGVAMDVEEVRACRDLGLELPPDCTVEIQCYGISAGGDDSSGADSPCAGGVSSPGADPMDVKARLKVWAQAVALTSTTQLGS